MNECPVCGEPDPIFYRGSSDEEYTEPDIYECPECGWAAEA